MYDLGKIRTFLSLNVESSLKSMLGAIQDDVKTELKNYHVKWENPDKFHLTLRYLGDIDESKIEELAYILDRLKVEFESIKFAVDDIGFFPNQKYPNVVFISLAEEGNNSGKLVEFIDKILASFGIKPDKKFIPHITLGRFRRDKRICLDKPVEVNVVPANIEFDRFCLMKSVLQSGGSEHYIIQEFKFCK